METNYKNLQAFLNAQFVGKTITVGNEKGKVKNVEQREHQTGECNYLVFTIDKSREQKPSDPIYLYEEESFTISDEQDQTATIPNNSNSPDPRTQVGAVFTIELPDGKKVKLKTCKGKGIGETCSKCYGSFNEDDKVCYDLLPKCTNRDDGLELYFKELKD